MGLFTSSKKKEEVNAAGLTQERVSVTAARLTSNVGSNDLDAVLQTFAPNTTKQIDLNLQLAMRIIDFLKVIDERQVMIKEKIISLEQEINDLKNKQDDKLLQEYR